MSPKCIALLFINIVFQVTCFTAAGYFIFNQFEDYYGNQDVSYVSYRRFNERPIDVYPSLSFCIYSSSASQLLMQEKMKGINSTISPYVYADMSLGYTNITKEFNETPFDDITIDFSNDIMLWFHTRTTDGKWKYLYNNKWNQSSETLFYNSYQDPFQRCYTRDNDYEPKVILDHDVLVVNATKLFERPKRRLRIYVHYKKQLIRQLGKPVLEVVRQDFKQYNIGSDQLKLDVNEVELLRKRPNAPKPCSNTITNDDVEYMKVAMDILGCIPSYWKRFVTTESMNTLNLQRCNSKKQYLSLSQHLLPEDDTNNVTKHYLQPCNHLTTEIRMTKQAKDMRSGKNYRLRLQINYNTEMYRESINRKSCTLGNLWSSIGGFIGIFLGYSLMQVFLTFP